VVASIGADAAVFHVVGVSLALLGAKPTSCLACPDHVSEQRLVRSSASRGKRACDGANVGAVKTGSDALDHFLDHLLAKAGVRTSRACLSAVEALLDTANQGTVDGAADVRMCRNDLLYVHGVLQLVMKELGSAPNTTNPPLCALIPDWQHSGRWLEAENPA
jgi:hypothetical protein